MHVIIAYDDSLLLDLGNAPPSQSHADPTDEDSNSRKAGEASYGLRKLSDKPTITRITYAAASRSWADT
jgi:hypothetical protein